MTTAGTLPSSRVMPHGLRRGLRPVRYYDPLGLPLRTLDFALGLYERACPDSGRADGPLTFRSMSLHACCAPYPAAVTSALRISPR
jgi:hypothetical protein